MSIAITELEKWDEKIQELVKAYQLNCYPQEFDICDHNEMLGFMAYSGMPSRYSHWSFGKSFEKQRTLYNFGVSGLPYEMVINSNPCLAYLMRDNSLSLQILTIAHVYGHNDFFANNFTFTSSIDAKYTIEIFKNHAKRVDSYIEDPSIGIDRVENIFDNAHPLSLQRSKNLAITRLSPEEQAQRLIDKNTPKKREFDEIQIREELPPDPKLSKFPIEPEENILEFIATYSPFLSSWEKDLLLIVDKESKYFIPQIDTKIMNEGWASYWHYQLMNALNLPQDIHLEFIANHSRVLTPHPGGLNPYHLGFIMWHDIEDRVNAEHGGPTRQELIEMPIAEQNETPGRKKIFEIRESDRDIAFLRRFLTEDILRELDLFQHEAKGDERVITKVADEHSWQDIKNTLIQNTGTNGLPCIKIEDADFGKNRTLYLKHYHDGRDLQLQEAEACIKSIAKLWRREVVLETVVNHDEVHLKFINDEFKIQKK